MQSLKRPFRKFIRRASTLSVVLGWFGGVMAVPVSYTIENPADTVPLIEGTAEGDLLIFQQQEWSALGAGNSNEFLKMSEADSMEWGTMESGMLFSGCMDPEACNYDEMASVHHPATCFYGFCAGCTDELALNYDNQVNQDDGSCVYEATQGCTLSAATNYNPQATDNDGSCLFDQAFVCGTSTIEFDGHAYKTILVNERCWFAENLRSTHYQNGDEIPEEGQAGWSSTQWGAQTVYGANGFPCDGECDEVENLETMGRLYNWLAVSDSRGICPAGWEVPKEQEWMELEYALGVSLGELGQIGFRGLHISEQLKQDSSAWASWSGTNSYQFNALPGGYLSPDGGGFSALGHSGYWWSSSALSLGRNRWYRTLGMAGGIGRWAADERHGLSIRCIQDGNAPVLVLGCTNPNFLEYSEEANLDDGTCATPIVEGCTNSSFMEFDPLANTDDGSCFTFIIEGCSDPSFIEYDPAVNMDNGSCSVLVVEGCTDPNFIEFDPSANTDDGSCLTPQTTGCTDSAYLEYNPNADVDDGSCSTLIVEGCTDADYLEYDSSANVDDGSCSTLIVEGCTDADYLEYDSSANVDDGSCSTLIVEGCTDAGYLEYDGSANVDDGSCSTLIVEGCTDSSAMNYNPNATVDDGTCEFDACEGQESVTYDSYTYDLHTIGDQCWFTENLRADNYRNGDLIDYFDSYDAFNSGNGSQLPALDFANDGRVYTFYAVEDSRGICPSGFHVPTDAEWIELEVELGMSYSVALNQLGWRGTDEGDKLKSNYWDTFLVGNNRWNGSNEVGFTAVPVEFMSCFNFPCNWTGGSNSNAFFWTSTESGDLGALFRHLATNQNGIERGGQFKHYGMSVRCLKN